MKQLSFFKELPKEHGGSLSEGKRKESRPLNSKKIHHIVLKANGDVSLYKNRYFITKTIKRQAELAGLKVYNYSIQNDHVHLSTYFSHRQNYKRFIRSTTSLLSRKFGRGLWKYIPYSRIVEWGQDSKRLQNYIEMNELEGHGDIGYQKRT